MVSGWQSFDRQIKPYPERLWLRPCGVAWEAVPEPKVEYIELAPKRVSHRNRIKQETANQYN